MSDNWAKLHNGETYKVYNDPSGWWNPMRYTVAGPSGSVITCAMTRWGARRAARRHARRAVAEAWWDRPLVEEIDPAGGR